MSRESETADALPTTVWEGSFDVMGVTVRACVLSDGRRILNAEDVEALFAGNDAADPHPGEPMNAEAIARFCRGDPL